MDRPVLVARLALGRYQALQHGLCNFMVVPSAQDGDQINVYAQDTEEGSVAIPYLVRRATPEGGATLCYVEKMHGQGPHPKGDFW